MKAISIAFAVLLASIPATLPSYAGERIVSLAPSVTETLFAIGAGPEVVGVCRYCRFPEEVKSLPKVGGFIDPDFEAIIRLKPTLVVMTDDNKKAETRLKSFGLRTLSIDNRNVKGILASYIALGEACGHVAEAKALADDATLKLERIKNLTQNVQRPRVLLCMGRSLGGGIGEVFAAGRSAGVYEDLIGLAGGVNVCANAGGKAPALSAEGVIRLNPEVIIDLAPPGADTKAMLADWAGLRNVAAVRDSRIHVTSADYAQIPGPRFLLILDDMLNYIHPELKADAK